MIRENSQAKLHLFLRAIENQLNNNDMELLLAQCKKIFADEPDLYKEIEKILHSNHDNSLVGGLGGAS